MTHFIPPSHIYSHFEGTGGPPIPLGYVLINPPSHIKRNLDFYPYYFEYAAKIDSATQVLGSYFLQDP